MVTGIYVAAINPGSGKSLVSLGLGETLHSKADRIGYFRPIAQGETPDSDPMLNLMRNLFGLTKDQVRGGLTQHEARTKIVDGNIDDISHHAVQIFSEMSEHCDVIIVEGTELDTNDSGVEFSLNITLANNLGAPVLGVVNAKDLNTDEVVGTIDVARRELTESHASILGFIVNRADKAAIKNIGEAAHRGANNRPVYVLPELHDITQPTVAEVARSLNLRQIAGDANHSDRDVQSIKVAAMTVANFMHELNDGALVIVPGDRSDAIVGTMASAVIPEFPVPSGMILTGGLPIGENMQALLDRAPFPVFEFAADTYTTANEVSKVRSEMSTGHRRKVSAAFGAWNTYISGEELVERLELPRPQKMTPLRFLNKLVIRARNDKKRIVLPEGNDERILRAAEILCRLNVCKIVILGNKSSIHELASTIGVDIEGIELIDPQTSALREEFAHEYAKLRAHKGTTLEKARDVMLSGNYFGTMMVRQNIADGMVSGAANTTADTIRPALEFIKTAPGVNLVSSVFFMLMKDRVLVYGDCAINPAPTSEQLADIAIASAETSSQFDVTPKIAMLSYSTGTSGSGADVDKVRAATEIVRKRCPHLMVEGPIQYDAAVNAATAASKLPHSEVAGQATVFIFPDLNTGNNTYKAVQQTADAVAVGPVLQGLRKPVNDLSRGCTVDDIVNTVAITAIQARER